MQRIHVRLHRPTAGTRIAVWLFPLVTTWLGVAYLGPEQRLRSPSYSAAESIMPMHAWGAAFLILAAVKVWFIVQGTIRGFLIAMCAGMGLFAMWAFLFFASIFIDPHAALGGPALPLGWVGAHVAVLATMTERG